MLKFVLKCKKITLFSTDETLNFSKHFFTPATLFTQLSFRVVRCNQTFRVNRRPSLFEHLLSEVLTMRDFLIDPMFWYLKLITTIYPRTSKTAIEQHIFHHLLYAGTFDSWNTEYINKFKIFKRYLVTLSGTTIVIS